MLGKEVFKHAEAARTRGAAERIGALIGNRNDPIFFAYHTRLDLLIEHLRERRRQPSG